MNRREDKIYNSQMQYIAYYELNVLLRLKYVLTDSHILRDQRIADRDGTSQYRRYIVGNFFFLNYEYWQGNSSR
jgi:hypothetical protein